MLKQNLRISHTIPQSKTQVMVIVHRLEDVKMLEVVLLENRCEFKQVKIDFFQQTARCVD